MIKVLDSSKTLSALVADTTNGLGQLKVMNDLVTEELNGIYELEFDILTTENHYQDLVDNRLVKVNVNEMDDEQIFRVYEITPSINFTAHVRCQHITYDLSKIVVKPFTATGAVSIKNGLVTYMLGSYPFTTWTDITNTTSTFTNDIPRNFRECLGGYEGSVLDVLRPEYEWDNLTVKLHARRGSDHDTRIAYGKNLTDFEQEENNENVYDAVYGYAVVDEVTYEASSIYNKTGATYPKVLNVDFSSHYQSGETPTGAELLQYATDYATNNDIEIPSVNIKISFVPLWQTEEYKNIAPLERVFLGDTVHVYFDKLGVEASSRVIKTVWSPSLKRYEEIELGSARANLNTVINDTVKEATDGIADAISVDTGFIEQQLDELSSLIINGLGLYKTEEQVPGGGVRIILHNKPLLADSDTQYYMSSAGIMVSTDFGTTWTAGFDAQTGELFTQALSTITLKALEIYGSYIEGSVMMFGDPTDKFISVNPFDYDGDNVVDGVTFDGNGYIRFQPQGSFTINNVNSNGDTLNYFQMEASQSQYHNIFMRNYNPSDLSSGNVFSIVANASSGNSTNLINYSFTRANAQSNSILMSNNSTESSITIKNWNVGLSTSNSIEMKSDGTMKFYSSSDMQLLSGGAIRMQSQSSQDIVFQASDDLHMNYGDKLYFNGHQITLGTGGYVMWTA